MAFSRTMNFLVNGLKAHSRWDKKVFLHLITFNGCLARVGACIYDTLWHCAGAFLSAFYGLKSSIAQENFLHLQFKNFHPLH